MRIGTALASGAPSAAVLGTGALGWLRPQPGRFRPAHRKRWCPAHGTALAGRSGVCEPHSLAPVPPDSVSPDSASTCRTPPHSPVQSSSPAQRWRRARSQRLRSRIDQAQGLAGTASVSAQYPVFDGTFDAAASVALSHTSAFRGVWLYRPAVIGSVTCTPAVPNSSGSPAEVHAAGSTAVAHADLVLHATGLPQQSAGYFLCSQQTATVPLAGGGQGTLCLGGALGRFSNQVLNSGATGRFAFRVDVSSLPTPAGPRAALSGETWSFQAWYRDANP